MNKKKISGLIALGMIFSIATGPIASANELNKESTNQDIKALDEEVVENKTIEDDEKVLELEEVSHVNYEQNFDDGNISNWNKIWGGGQFEAAEQGLRVQGGNAFTSPDGKQFSLFADNEAPLVKDGVFEADLKVRSHAGRFGIVLRYVDENNYDVLGYDVGNTWVHINNTNGSETLKQITTSGPSMNNNTDHKLKVEFIGKNVNLMVDGNSIFKGDILSDGRAGKIGFRAWGYDGNYSNVIYDNLTLKSVTEVSIDKAEAYIPYSEIGTYDIDVNVSNLDNKLIGLSTSSYDLVEGTDYTINGTTISIKKEFIEKVKDDGITNIYFNFEDGYKCTFKLQVQAAPDETVEYLRDFSKDGIDGISTVRGNGEVVLQNNKLNMKTNNDMIVIDDNSPNLSNSEVEFVINPINDNGNFGVVLRYVNENSWTYIGKDGASTEWGSKWYVLNSNDDRRELFSDSARIYSRRVEPYTMKFRVIEDVLTVYLDGAEIFNGVVNELTNGKGKSGFRVHGNSGASVQYMSVQTQQKLAPKNINVEKQEIKSDTLTVGLDNDFPRVLDYTLSNNKKMTGDVTQNYEVEINTNRYTPSVISEFTENKAIYKMTIEELEMSFDVVYELDGNVLSMDVENIDDSKTKLYTLNFPENSMVSLNSSVKGAKFKGANYKKEVGYDIETKAPENGQNVTTIPILIGDGIAASMTNSSIKSQREVAYKSFGLLDGTTSTGIWTNEFMYRGLLDGEIIEKPWAKVVLTEDRNKDNVVDYFDGAIAYRDDIKTEKLGVDIVQNSYSSIAMNVGSVAQYPFLRILDNVKKFNLGTDGFGQNIIIKGYQSEGHDSAHPDFANINKRAGGAEDFQTLLRESDKYNANIGIHINHTEAYPEAKQYNENLVSDVGAWSWYDSARHIIRENDILNKEDGMEKRLDDLAAIAQGLDLVYVDVYDDTRWPAHKLGKKLNDLGWAVASEYAPALSHYSVWGHQLPGDYNNAGNLIKFVNHQEQEIFASTQLFRGQPSAYRVNGFNGWQGASNYNETIKDFYINVLPNKYLMNFPLSKWIDNNKAEFGANNEVVSTVENGVNKITKDGKLIAQGNKIFMPWNPQTEEKIYCWTDVNESKNWELPNSWSGLEEVYIYELTDTGKINEQAINVNGEKVKLEIKPNTPYVIYKEKASVNEDVKWGEGSIVKDMGFDSHNWDYAWSKATTGENSEHINFINNKKGNTVLRIDGNNGADATVTQTMTGLVPGQVYSASAWVEIKGERMTELSVLTPDGKEYKNYVDITNVNYGSTHNDKLNTNYQRVKFQFIQPEGLTTAQFKINVAKGDTNTAVDIDDVRVVPVDATDTKGHDFYEDFENVDQEYGPFVSTKSDNSHLSETNKPYTNDTIDGKFSMKIRSGDYMRTLPHRIRFKPNTTYKIGLEYLSSVDEAFTLGIKSDKANSVGDTENAVLISEVCSKQGKAEVEFTTGDYNDYYIDITSKKASEYILDNLYVDQISNEVELPIEKPNKITELEAISTNKDNIKIDWQAPTNTKINEYIIYLDGKEFTKTTETELEINNLKANTLYSLKVIAVGSDGQKSTPATLNIRTKK
ncbi:MAG: endo-alpha-N-acetylgalactosaminidase family protein [Sarcina sp.]